MDRIRCLPHAGRAKHANQLATSESRAVSAESEAIELRLRYAAAEDLAQDQLEEAEANAAKQTARLRAGRSSRDSLRVSAFPRMLVLN